MLGLHVGEAAATSDGAGSAMGDVYVAGAATPWEGECTTLVSLVANDEDCTHAATDGGILQRRMIPG